MSNKLVYVFLLSAALAAPFLAGCDGSVFGSVVIADGTQNAEASQTVNGSISVGNDVTVTSGTFRTVNGAAVVGQRSTVPGISVVNGAIRIGEDSRTGELETVNGAIVLSERAQSSSNVQTVNGEVRAAPGAGIAGSVRAVNGRITLNGVAVAGNIENVNGGIVLSGVTVVEGDLIVRKTQGLSLDTSDPPSVVIGPEVQVKGRLTFERPVDLQIHRGAQVGEITGATPTWIEPTATRVEDNEG